MNKNMGGNICSVKASIVGFNLIFEPTRSSYPAWGYHPQSKGDHGELAMPHSEQPK